MKNPPSISASSCRDHILVQANVLARVLPGGAPHLESAVSVQTGRTSEHALQTWGMTPTGFRLTHPTLTTTLAPTSQSCTADTCCSTAYSCCGGREGHTDGQAPKPLSSLGASRPIPPQHLASIPLETATPDPLASLHGGEGFA